MPACAISSTTYCTVGLRPTGSISLGWDLVAGSRRVPGPATGITALRTVRAGVELAIWLSPAVVSRAAFLLPAAPRGQAHRHAGSTRPTGERYQGRHRGSNEWYFQIYAAPRRARFSLTLF